MLNPIWLQLAVHSGSVYWTADFNQIVLNPEKSRLVKKHWVWSWVYYISSFPKIEFHKINFLQEFYNKIMFS